MMFSLNLGVPVLFNSMTDIWKVLWQECSYGFNSPSKSIVHYCMEHTNDQ